MTTPQIEEQSPPRDSIPKQRLTIETSRLTKVFPGGTRAVDALDLEIEDGEFFGLLGPNGAGKTTTIGMLTTRVVPTSGEMWIAGHEQDERHRITVMLVDEGMRSAWPELPMIAADWQALDANPSGIFLTRTAAARRDVRVGDTVTVNGGPGATADGTGIYYFTVLGLIPDPAGSGAGSVGPRGDLETIVGSSFWLTSGTMLGSARASERGRGTLTTLGIEDLLTERPTLAIPRLCHNA